MDFLKLQKYEQLKNIMFNMSPENVTDFLNTDVFIKDLGTNITPLRYALMTNKPEAANILLNSFHSHMCFYKCKHYNKDDTVLLNKYGYKSYDDFIKGDKMSFVSFYLKKIYNNIFM